MSCGQCPEPSPCAAVCPVGLCDDIRDADKVECAECAACHAEDDDHDDDDDDHDHDHDDDDDDDGHDQVWPPAATLEGQTCSSSWTNCEGCTSTGDYCGTPSGARGESMPRSTDCAMTNCVVVCGENLCPGASHGPISLSSSCGAFNCFDGAHINGYDISCDTGLTEGECAAKCCDQAGCKGFDFSAAEGGRCCTGHVSRVEGGFEHNDGTYRSCEKNSVTDELPPLTPSPSPSPSPSPNAALRLVGHSCANGYNAALNEAIYALEGTTLDGRPFYRALGGGQRGQSGESYLFYDVDCGTHASGWILGCSRPDTTATSHLQTEGVVMTGCCTDGVADDHGQTPPLSAAWWLYCGSGESGTQQLEFVVMNPPPLTPSPWPSDPSSIAGYTNPCLDPDAYTPMAFGIPHCLGDETTDQDKCLDRGCDFNDDPSNGWPMECFCPTQALCEGVGDGAYWEKRMCTTPTEDAWDLFGRSTCDARVMRDLWAASEIMAWWGGSCCGGQAALCSADEPKPSLTPSPTWHVPVGGVPLSGAQSSAACADLGERLCHYDELCPGGMYTPARDLPAQHSSYMPFYDASHGSRRWTTGDCLVH